MKYLFIELTVREGEREHDHRVLHTTNAKNINFAAEIYASRYWGWGVKEDDYWWFFNEITVRVRKVLELTKREYDFISSIF